MGTIRMTSTSPARRPVVRRRGAPSERAREWRYDWDMTSHIRRGLRKLKRVAIRRSGARGVRRTVRSLGIRMGLLAPATDPPGREVGSDWYDRAYRTVPEYHEHYSRSRYYFLWTVIADRVCRGRSRVVLEVGCGPGHLAALLLDRGL